MWTLGWPPFGSLVFEWEYFFLGVKRGVIHGVDLGGLSERVGKARLKLAGFALSRGWYRLALVVFPLHQEQLQVSPAWVRLASTFARKARLEGAESIADAVSHQLALSLRGPNRVAELFEAAFGLGASEATKIRSRGLTGGQANAYCFVHSVEIGGQYHGIVEKALGRAGTNELRFAKLVLTDRVDTSGCNVPRFFAADHTRGMALLFQEYVAKDLEQKATYPLEIALKIARKIGRFSALNPVQNGEDLGLRINPRMHVLRVPSERALISVFPKIPESEIFDIKDKMDRVAREMPVWDDAVAKLPHALAHNDISTGNVIVHDGEPFFIDWGWAAPVPLGADLYGLIHITPGAVSDEYVRGALMQAYRNGLESGGQRGYPCDRDLEMALWWGFARRYVPLLREDYWECLVLAVEKSVDIIGRLKADEGVAVSPGPSGRGGLLS